MDTAARLSSIRATARLAINRARIVRKTLPKGPYSSIEEVTIAALLKIEEEVDCLLNSKPPGELRPPARSALSRHAQS